MILQLKKINLETNKKQYLVEFCESGMDEGWAGAVKRGGKGSSRKTGLGMPVQAAELGAGTQVDTDGACSVSSQGWSSWGFPSLQGSPNPSPKLKARCLSCPVQPWDQVLGTDVR